MGWINILTSADASVGTCWSIPPSTDIFYLELKVALDSINLTLPVRLVQPRYWGNPPSHYVSPHGCSLWTPGTPPPFHSLISYPASRSSIAEVLRGPPSHYVSPHGCSLWTPPPPHILPRQSVQYSCRVEGVPHLIMYLHTAVAYEPPPPSAPSYLTPPVCPV